MNGKQTFISLDKQSVLLGCDTVSLDEWFLTFWRHVVPLKRQKPLTQWHSVTSQKT
jgi:hypothetical protein